MNASAPEPQPKPKSADQSQQKLDNPDALRLRTPQARVAEHEGTASTRSFRNALHAVLHDNYLDDDRLLIDHHRQRFNQVLPDLFYFRYQLEVLEQHQIPQFAASFVDGARHLPVLVQVPDLHNIDMSYSSVLKSLEDSGIALSKADKSQAEKIFVDRLSEFMAKGAETDGLNLPLTIVHTEEPGEVVVYAKGYFLSTGAGFGISTPARKALSSGRYAFGIRHGETTRFDSTLWSCPTELKVEFR